MQAMLARSDRGERLVLSGCRLCFLSIALKRTVARRSFIVRICAANTFTDMLARYARRAIMYCSSLLRLLFCFSSRAAVCNARRTSASGFAYRFRASVSTLSSAISCAFQLISKAPLVVSTCPVRNTDFSTCRNSSSAS